MAEEGAVAVCVRVRPPDSREEALGEDTQVCWKTGNNAIYQVDGSKSFNFDRVFDSNETTKDVYEEIAVPIIESAIQGYNGTIFAYGQTASGKTYTMMGSGDYLGVIPRAIHDIFQKIEKFPDREFLLRVSYMKIYNETITDLLCDTRKMKPLIIREDFNRNMYVSDLTEEVVSTSEMALKWIRKGEKNRHYGITKMNQRSSRSHTIFRMILESREKGEPSNCEGSVKVSHLNLVDLAGSERAAQTGAEGVRLKEGCNINRSLFILGQVIKKLSDGQVGGFINYRDSKLTRILQNSLGGNAKTRIICTITPVSFDETLSTLQFASTAKYMKNTPYVNEVSSDEALLKRYRKEIMDLKKQLEEVSTETRAQAMEKDQLAQLLEEKDLLQKVQIEKIQNLTRMLVTSSSLTSQQELKAKIKRRVTWCPGKINKMKESNYVNEFNMPVNTIKRQRSGVTSIGEIDESICSEADIFSNTLDTITDIEWNPATKLLSQENLESELNSLRANYDNLMLEYGKLRKENEEMELKLKEKNDLDEFEALERKVEKDQEENLESELNSLRANYDNLMLEYGKLRKENEEMELKLKEKNDLDEFEALERKAEKDQEMQLIHEISNLKNLVKHAEVYNQNLENELSSKVDLLREKEDQIKKLQKYIDSQNSESVKTDLSYSLIMLFYDHLKIQELTANEHQLLKLKDEINEMQKKMSEMEQLKNQFKAQSVTLGKMEMENLNLAQKLHENLEEMKSVMKERDHLRRVEETLKLERDQLKANLQETIVRDLETQKELKIARIHLKEHQETIDKFRESVSEKTTQISNIQKDLNKSKDDLQIKTIVNESTEFEERNATLAKEWELDLKSVREENEKLFKICQTLKLSQTPGALANPTTQDDKNLHVTSRVTQPIKEKIQELEASPHEAKESAMHKEDTVIKMQKELRLTYDMIEKLQAQVKESNKCLEKTKEMTQELQDKVSLGAKPYKEEIEDLKMKLVKTDLENKKIVKELEKEIASTKATVEYQKEAIRLLRENLRRSQQAQDTTMVLEVNDSKPSNKPLTCGGGSGIVQSTKALILKSENVRLKKEISKSKQHNEQLINQKNEPSSNHHLPNEALKDVTCENSPKTPKRAASEKRHRTPSRCQEQNLPDPVPKEAPQYRFFDSRLKSFPVPHPVRYFDNSNLGLCPEEPAAGGENVAPQAAVRASRKRTCPSARRSSRLSRSGRAPRLSLPGSPPQLRHSPT